MYIYSYIGIMREQMLGGQTSRFGELIFNSLRSGGIPPEICDLTVLIGHYGGNMKIYY